MARKVRNFKANDEEYGKIKENARLYAGGNVSRWLKRAGAEYVPPLPLKPSPLTPEEIVEDEQS